VVLVFLALLVLVTSAGAAPADCRIVLTAAHCESDTLVSECLGAGMPCGGQLQPPASLKPSPLPQLPKPKTRFIPLHAEPLPADILELLVVLFPVGMRHKVGRVTFGPRKIVLMTRLPNFRPSQRGAAPSIAEQLHQRALAIEATGQDILYLQVGQPSTGAPAGCLEALQEAAAHSTLGYTNAAGNADLRQRIARQYAELYSAEVSPENIVVTFGASGAMSLAVVGCFDVGQRIAMPKPFYYGYRYALETLGVECVLFETSMENDFQPTIADLEGIEGPIDGLIVTSPGNPTGSMIGPDQLRDLALYCEKKGIRFISDEIYHGIVYDDDIPQATAASFSKEAIVINSFSKYYSMAGWRLGWMVVPDNLAVPITNLAHNLYLAPPAPSQVAALPALDARKELDGHVARYRRNRDIFLDRLPKIGFDRFTAPHGAFYFYCHVQHMHEDSVQFCIEMMEKAHVLAAPGSDFCPDTGKHFIRFSYAGATDLVEAAIDRIAAWRGKA